MTREIALSVLPGALSVCRLEPSSAVPDWATGGGWFSVTRTADELSVICESARVPTDVQRDDDWRALKLEGPFEFTEIGVLAPIAAALAAERISVLAVATYETDHVLVKARNVSRAIRRLESAGYRVRSR